MSFLEHEYSECEDCYAEAEAACEAVDVWLARVHDRSKVDIVSEYASHFDYTEVWMKPKVRPQDHDLLYTNNGE